MTQPRTSRTRSHRPRHRILRRIAIALTLAVLTETAIIGATLYRPVARLRKAVNLTMSSVVVRSGDLYWAVDITRFGPSETQIRSEAVTTLEDARKLVESAYNAVDTLGGNTGRSTLRAELPRPVPAWATFRDHDPTPYRIPIYDGHFSYHLDEVAVGWPWRCVHGWTLWTGKWPPLDAQGRTTGTPALQTTTRGLVRFDENAFPLPTLPIWRGLIASLLLLALPWYLLMHLATAGRRARRRRRGRCPVCGYDLMGIAGRCPECGASPDAEPAAPPGA